MLYGYRQFYNLHKNVVYIKMLFIKTLQNKWKEDLILQTMNQIDHYPKEKSKKVIGLVKDILGGKIINEFVRLTSKTWHKKKT